MLQLKKFRNIPDSTREEARESRPHPEEPRFRLLAREEGSCPRVVGKEFPAFPSHLKWRRSPQERREELQCRACLRMDQEIRGFPSRLSHEAFPQGCPTCHRGVSRSSARNSRQCREIRFPWNGLRHLGDSGNGGTTLEFLSPFLWRAPPLEMRRELWEFFPDHAGKGSFLSS